MNLEEEIRNGYKISADMKKVWALQMKMAKYVLEVCKKYNLRIWADGGTLLGTVREHGYIPWDDDIDFFMLRADYDKLCSLAEKEFQHPYFLQCFKTERHYYRGHAQLRYDGTTAILKSDINCPYHQGIFVDIFCYDNIPDSYSDLFFQKLINASKVKAILNTWVDSPLTSFFSFASIKHPKATLRKIRAHIYCIFHGNDRMFKKIEDSFRVYSKSETKYINCPCFNIIDYKKTLRKREWINETIMMPFEDMELPVPAGYDLILSTQYGDNYMTPVQAPTIHGGFAVLDTEKSYKEYLKEVHARRTSI